MSETDSLLNSDDLKEVIDELQKQNAKLQIGIIEAQERARKLETECNGLKFELKQQKQIESESELNRTKSELEKMKVDFENLKQLLESKDLNEMKCEEQNSNEEESSIIERLNELEKEVEEKSEIIKELNKTKLFLADNNSKLLSDIIRMQVFVESLGLRPIELDAYKDVLERSTKAQLKYCDDECEQVMVKLGQLNHGNLKKKSNILYV